MGYYNSSEPKKKSKGNFVSGFAGVLAGALLAGVVLPGFTDTEEEPAIETRQVENVSSVENVSTVTTTDVTDIVDATSEAVVGVSNLQAARQNPFSQSPSGELRKQVRVLASSIRSMEIQRISSRITTLWKGPIKWPSH